MKSTKRRSIKKEDPLDSFELEERLGISELVFHCYCILNNKDYEGDDLIYRDKDHKWAKEILKIVDIRIK